MSAEGRVVPFCLPCGAAIHQRSSSRPSRTGTSDATRMACGRLPRRWACRSPLSGAGCALPPGGRAFGRLPCAVGRAASETSAVVIRLTADGPDLKGLTVETAAPLLTLMR